MKELTMEQLKELVSGAASEAAKAAVTDAMKDAEKSIATIRKEVVATKGADADASLTVLKGVERELSFFKALVISDDAGIQEKALSEGVGTEGGYLVPTEFEARVMEKRENVNDLRKYCTVLPTQSGNGEMPKEGTGVTVERPGENTAPTGSSPDFGQVTYSVSKAIAYVEMSQELLRDAGIPMLDFLAGLFAKGFRKDDETMIVGGTGTAQPEGFRSAGLTGIAMGAAALSYDDTVNLYYTLERDRRANGIFLTSNAGIRLLAKIKDADSMPILFVPKTEGGVSVMFGRPVIESTVIPENLGVGTDETEIWFIDLSSYMIADRQGMEIATSMEAGDTFKKHQMALKAVKRWDGKLTQDEAAQFLTAVL